MKGRVKLYIDLNEGEGNPFYFPFNMYMEGSYFGDSDVLLGES